MTALGYRPAWVNRFGTTTAVVQVWDPENAWYRDYERLATVRETAQFLRLSRRRHSMWDELEWDELLCIPPKPPVSEHAECYDLLPEVGYPLDEARVRAAWRRLPQRVRDGSIDDEEQVAPVLAPITPKPKRKKAKRYSRKSRIRTIRLEDHNNWQLISDAADRLTFDDDGHWFGPVNTVGVWDHRGNWCQIRIAKAMWLMEFGDPLDSRDHIVRSCDQQGCVSPIHHTRRDFTR